MIRRYHGRWHARVQSDAVEFIHELQTTWGDAYRYIKRDSPSIPRRYAKSAVH
ncbi:MAG: hypothetical protein MUF51_06330 [Vicinamibacteria bacterium]|nr:hypothetical protein [Vicinamibacteria bacterium]